jgi:hypothetical protein
MTNIYHYKYNKYKFKYLNLKKQIGGMQRLVASHSEDGMLYDDICKKCENIDQKIKLYNANCEPENEINPTKNLARFSSIDIISKKITSLKCEKSYYVTDEKIVKNTIANFINDYYIDVGIFIPRKIINNLMLIMNTSLNDTIQYYYNLIDYNIEQRNYNNKNITKCVEYFKNNNTYDTHNDFFIRGIYLTDYHLNQIIPYINNNNILSSACCRCKRYMDQR